MDPYNNQRDARNQPNPGKTTSGASGTSGTSGTSGSGETPDTADRGSPGSRNPPATSREPQHLGGFTKFPPNESRRSKMTMMAQKEEQEIQRWKEENRPSAVHETPEKLGGNATLAAAREKQFADLRCTKLHKKLKKEEADKRRRQEEEQKNQNMKAEQRKKAERLEEKKRQEDQRRGEQLRPDHARKRESFLQRVENSASGQLASSSATHTPSRSEAVESKQRAESRSVRNVQLEHRRVNSAFLDNLDGRMREKERGEEGVQECPFRHLPSNLPGQDLNPDPQQSYQDWTQEAEPDYEWSLMKLMNSFPDYSRAFLEGILDQCKGDYQQAYTLLDCTQN